MVTRDGLRIMMLIGLTFALVVGGCKKEPEPVEPPEEVDILIPDEGEVVEEVPEETPETVVEAEQIVPLVGVGTIKFGMSVDEVTDVLGEPEREEGGGIAMFYLGSMGLNITTEPTKGVREIHCWSADYPIPAPEAIGTFAGRTEKGIAMGASREQIIAAYGQPDSDETKGPVQVLMYNQLKMQFDLAGDNLVHIALKGP
jgi:hypothetical protein